MLQAQTCEPAEGRRAACFLIPIKMHSSFRTTAGKKRHCFAVLCVEFHFIYALCTGNNVEHGLFFSGKSTITEGRDMIWLHVYKFAARKRHNFGDGCSFRKEDYVKGDHPDCIYDAVLALSITKWIHFNHGDAGIKKFFKKIFESLCEGGVFVLEWQVRFGLFFGCGWV